MAETARLIGGPLARALEDGRPRFNALFAQARAATPSLDTAAFADHLRDVVAPIVAAVEGIDPGRVPETAEVLFELSLAIVSREMPARFPAIRDGWGPLLLGLSRHLAAAPRRLAGSLTNALFNLSQVPGTRPGKWVQELLRLGPLCPAPETVLELGQVLAWKVGMAHFRSAALDLCLNLPPPLTSAALGWAGEEEELACVVEKLRRNPWHDPAEAGDDDRLKLVARVGGFRGFGGPFLRPPRVARADAHFLIADGESTWVLTADRHGATFHRTSMAFPTSTEPGGAFQVDRKGTVKSLGLSSRFEELEDCSGSVSDDTTCLITLPHSHRVYVVARA